MSLASERASSKERSRDGSWSPQQEDALKAVGRWLRTGGPQVFRLFGYAGTGKTTLAQEIAASVRGTVLFAAFTGKAASVLRSKGCDDASTIHSLIYRLEHENDGKPTFRKNRDSELRKASLLIVDECSMVDEELGRDLLSFGTPVLVLGDPGQLPPVKGEGFFTNGKPDFLLTEIHRQARDNPIIQLATDARQGKTLRPGDYGKARVIERADVDKAMVLEADQVLVGKNATRMSFNGFIREELGRHAGVPVPGDRIVCLRNNKDKGTLNGTLWDVNSVNHHGDRYKMLAQPADDPINGMTPLDVRREFFTGKEKDLPWFVLKHTDHFTFGNVLTVHKAQGSQWNDVILFDESRVFRESARNWLYTGITRAAERLTVVV